jgi:hypothetical protein
VIEIDVCGRCPDDRRVRLLFVVALVSGTGCRYLLGDADPQSNPDAPAKPLDRCGWGAGVLSADGLCLDALPTAPVLLDQLDTDGSACVSFTPADARYCVVAGTEVDVATDAHVTGSRALIVISSTKITIGATLDVGAHLAANTQAPGGEIDCLTGTPPTNSSFGGAGGSFAGAGGIGGAPNGADPRAQSAAATTLQPPTRLRGGCKGQTFNGNTGRAGFGGGAIYLAAYAAVQINGAVNASGAGGGGGPSPDRGGGGAGSGGMIVLDAPSVIFTGLLNASGGGGGEGAANNAMGANGEDGGGTEAALGGITTTAADDGGDGGNGSFVPTKEGAQGHRATMSGGGGGGGCGVIWVHGTDATLTGISSPSLVQL